MSMLVPGPLCRVLNQEAEILYLVLSGVSMLCTEHSLLPLSYLLWFGNLQPFLSTISSTMARGVILKNQGRDNGFFVMTPKAQQQKK